MGFTFPPIDFPSQTHIPRSAGAFRVYPKSKLTDLLLPAKYCYFVTAFAGKRTTSTNLNLWRKTMAYTKPQVIAQNASTGSYAAGCPADANGGDWQCKECERTE